MRRSMPAPGRSTSTPRSATRRSTSSSATAAAASTSTRSPRTGTASATASLTGCSATVVLPRSDRQQARGPRCGCTCPGRRVDRRRAMVEKRPAGPVGVVIVDDHAMFRRGVRAELESAGRGLVEIRAEAADVDEAVAAVTTCHPDVVLLDVHLPGGGGVEVMRKMASTGASPDTRYLALSVSDAAEDVI